MIKVLTVHHSTISRLERSDFRRSVTFRRIFCGSCLVVLVLHRKNRTKETSREMIELYKGSANLRSHRVRICHINKTNKKKKTTFSGFSKYQIITSSIFYTHRGVFFVFFDTFTRSTAQTTITTIFVPKFSLSKYIYRRPE